MLTIYNKWLYIMKLNEVHQFEINNESDLFDYISSYVEEHFDEVKEDSWENTLFNIKFGLSGYINFNISDDEIIRIIQHCFGLENQERQNSMHESKKPIKINEEQLRQMIKESTKKVLSEISFQTIDKANRKIGFSESEVFEAISTLQEALSTYDSDKFYTNGGNPEASLAYKYAKYLDEIGYYFKRKSKQVQNLDKEFQNRSAEYDKQILKIGNQMGFKGNSLSEMFRYMNYEDAEKLGEALPKDLKYYYETYC